MSVEQFDHLVQRVDHHRLQDLLATQVLWDAERTERLHQRTNKDLAEHVCITLLYHLYQRQYMMQEVLDACFGIEQGSVSNKPLTEAQKITNRVRSKVRISIEHTIRSIKISRSCADRQRKTTQKKHQRRWQIAAGIANLRLIHSSVKPELKALWA